jgi:ribonuclease BN (tRNA processing enzyme)
MRFTFLGTGTSSGIPAIGCDCAVCTSQDLRDQRLRTSGLIDFTDAKGQHRSILIDAGPDLRQQALRAKMTRCDAVLFTHNHVDHTFGLDEIRRFNVTMAGPIDVYGETRTIEHLHTVYQHIFNKAKNVNESFVATLIRIGSSPSRRSSCMGSRSPRSGCCTGGCRFWGTDLMRRRRCHPGPTRRFRSHIAPTYPAFRPKRGGTWAA